jgi:hypothetical protein
MSKTPRSPDTQGAPDFEATVELRADHFAPPAAPGPRKSPTQQPPAGGLAATLDLNDPAAAAALKQLRTMPFAEARGRESPYARPSDQAPGPRIESGTLDPEKARQIRELVAAEEGEPPPFAAVPPPQPLAPLPPATGAHVAPPAGNVFSRPGGWPAAPAPFAPPMAAPAPAPLASPAAAPAPAPPPIPSPRPSPPPPAVNRAAEGRGWRAATRAEAPPAPPAAPAAMSALDASNAAAGAPAPSPPAAATSLSPRAAGALPVELVYADPDLAARVRARPSYRQILSARRAPEVAGEALSDKQKDEQARRDVGLLLAVAEPSSGGALERAFAEALQDGVFVPPLLLVQGTLTLPFDEVAVLEGTVAATQPLAEPDKACRELLDEARELLKAPRVPGPATSAGALAARITDAHLRARRRLSRGYFDEHVDRLLLDRRAFQRRKLFGEPVLRALLTPPDGAAWVVYLPERIQDDLPLFQSFEARLFVEVRARADRHEAHPLALRAQALGRVLDRA